MGFSVQIAAQRERARKFRSTIRGRARKLRRAGDAAAADALIAKLAPKGREPVPPPLHPKGAAYARNKRRDARQKTERAYRRMCKVT